MYVEIRFDRCLQVAVVYSFGVIYLLCLFYLIMKCLGCTFDGSFLITGAVLATLWTAVEDHLVP